MLPILERATHRRKSIPKSAVLARKMALELDLVVDEHEVARLATIAFVWARFLYHLPTVYNIQMQYTDTIFLFRIRLLGTRDTPGDLP